jgi:hypothetical protein
MWFKSVYVDKFLNRKSTIGDRNFPILLPLVKDRLHQQIRSIMKQYRETQTGQEKCQVCPFKNRCPLAFYSFSFCPRLSPFVSLPGPRLFLTAKHVEELALIHVN